MSNQEIEAWALRVARNLTEKKPVEDSRVELKSEWPDPDKAARQLAAHLNAARRGDVLWIIGLDEKRGVIGAEQKEMSKWLPKVQAHFEGLKPTVIDLNIPLPTDGKEIVALLFKSDRAPYVVDVPGTDRFEVPWREGTRTRSARRDEILTAVIEHARDPEVEIQHLNLEGHMQPGSTTIWKMLLRFYIISMDDRTIVIPNHRCFGTIQFQAWGRLELSGGNFSRRPTDSIKWSETEIIVTRAGMLELNLNANVPASSMPDDPLIQVELRLQLVKPHMPLSFSGSARSSTKIVGRPNLRIWSFQK